MSSTTASSLAGVWLGELAAAVQGGWQALAASHGGQQQQHKAPAPAGAAAAGRKAAEDGDVRRCGGAMSDTTVYLLLDRFAPS
ncbi:hypothetical protein PVAP13_3NG307600 [Panicum virgatum]|uniref:Uncharacterized protein n=1 Tax=Panicum virgatum TaxID=38727 RepID=A0A8T0UCS3_PANVG|nr:hypothetical protein PVAP13_3NG307600 [Panicum virgatum]